MKNKYFLLTLGACLLFATSILALKSKKFSCVSTVYVSTAGGGCAQLITSGLCIFTTGGLGSQATPKTAGGTHSRKLWATNTCGSILGFRIPVHFIR